jgi:hypothetical protein
MSSNGRMGRNPFQKKVPREVTEVALAPVHAASEAEPAPELEEALPEESIEAVSLPSEPVQFIAAPSQIQEQPENQEPGATLESDSEVPSWMRAVAVTYRVALLTRFGAQVAVSEAQQFLHERLHQHQRAKRQGRA